MLNVSAMLPRERYRNNEREIGRISKRIGGNLGIIGRYG
jgi:hypothetical protein